VSVRWINERLGTAPALEARAIPDIHLLDVRDMVDKSGNSADVIRSKVAEGVEHLRAGDRVLVCCDYGISRSNSVAAGVLAAFADMSFWEAVRVVQRETGEDEIKLEPLTAVHRAIASDPKPRPRTRGKPKILVTGSSGFIGAAFCQAVAQEFELVLPSRADADLVRGATSLGVLAAETEVDCLVHLANPRVYTSNVALGQTLTMLRNVLDVCIGNDIRLVYPSGWEIYSGYAGDVYADEAVPPHPLGPYAETKLHAEWMIRHFVDTYGLRCGVLRSSPVYGPGSDRPKFIHGFIDKARRGETIRTHRYLNGPPALDLLHVDDLVAALVRMCRTDCNQAINIGTGVTITTPDVARLLVNLFNSASAVEQVQIEAHTARIAMNNDLAARLLDWAPTVSLQCGLKELLLETTQGAER
jgi:nucleoside-diphosphate-sugar epimerase